MQELLEQYIRVHAAGIAASKIGAERLHRQLHEGLSENAIWHSMLLVACKREPPN